mmetsp:Transcript_32048/g.68892  ORF Transcript_32048/g.68892 Transcript_32048/m.68892 type:complete len:327 (+) Transcript_32048:173-1153(+)
MQSVTAGTGSRTRCARQPRPLAVPRLRLPTVPTAPSGCPRRSSHIPRNYHLPRISAPTRRVSPHRRPSSGGQPSTSCRASGTWPSRRSRTTSRARARNRKAALQIRRSTGPQRIEVACVWSIPTRGDESPGRRTRMSSSGSTCSTLGPSGHSSPRCCQGGRNTRCATGGTAYRPPISAVCVPDTTWADCPSLAGLQAAPSNPTKFATCRHAATLALLPMPTREAPLAAPMAPCTAPASAPATPTSLNTTAALPYAPPTRHTPTPRASAQHSAPPSATAACPCRPPTPPADCSHLASRLSRPYRRCSRRRTRSRTTSLCSPARRRRC